MTYKITAANANGVSIYTDSPLQLEIGALINPEPRIVEVTRKFRENWSGPDYMSLYLGLCCIGGKDFSSIDYLDTPITIETITA